MSNSIEMSSQQSNGSTSLENVPRLCYLRKWPEHDQGSLGFNLITKKSGHFIERIDIGSPAYYCGMKDGDRIHEINGQNVVKLTHKVVANMIAESTSTGVAKLLVTDNETESRLKSKGLEVTTGSSDYQVKFISCPECKPDDGISNPRKDSKGPHVNPAFEFDDVHGNSGSTPSGYKNQPPARLCHLTKLSSENNFGFIVRTYSDNGEKVILSLDKDGVAARSGIRKNDYVIEINGFNILKENHNQIINRILSSGNVLKLLVVTEKENKWYKDRGLIPRENHSIEYKTEQKEGQNSSEDVTFRSRGESSKNERATSKGTSHKSDTGVTGKTDSQERGDWCGTGKKESDHQESPSSSSSSQEDNQDTEANYSRVLKPYDEVIEELQDKFTDGVGDTNGHPSNDSKSDEVLPLNDMTLGNVSINREESVVSEKSVVSQKVERFEVMATSDDSNSYSASPQLNGDHEQELPGLKKSVKEMRADLEKSGKKKRGKKSGAAAERMI